MRQNAFILRLNTIFIIKILLFMRQIAFILRQNAIFITKIFLFMRQNIIFITKFLLFMRQNAFILRQNTIFIIKILLFLQQISLFYLKMQLFKQQFFFYNSLPNFCGKSLLSLATNHFPLFATNRFISLLLKKRSKFLLSHHIGSTSKPNFLSRVAKKLRVRQAIAKKAKKTNNAKKSFLCFCLQSGWISMGKEAKRVIGFFKGIRRIKTIYDLLVNRG